jgi:selenocysteine lyase/cysteine desulfurase
MSWLRHLAIAVRAGAHCAPKMHRRLGTQKQGAVLFSFGGSYTLEETDAAIYAVRSIAEC